jgi:hypothetical protein
LVFKHADFVRINSLLYKFIWNKKYLAAKAPERLKRDIMNKSITLGGFGMLDIEELDKSLKLRALGRLMVSDHPMLELVRNKLNLTDFYHPRLAPTIDVFTAKAVELLGEARRNALLKPNFLNNARLLVLAKASSIRNWVRPACRNSLTIFDMRIRGKTKIGDLRECEVLKLGPILESRDFLPFLRRCSTIPNANVRECDLRLYPIGKQLKNLEDCSSKAIRLSLQNQEQICDFKIGLQLSIAESKTWLNNVRTLTNVRHRNAILRVAHGDVYANERCHRFRMTDDPNCPDCGQLETVKHKLLECRTKQAIWKAVFEKTCTLDPSIDSTTVTLEAALCATASCNQTALTIHAEIIILMLSNRNVVTEPSNLVERIIRTLSKRDKKDTIRTELRDLLNDDDH